MDVKDAIKLLEDISKNGNIKITEVNYYESTKHYKNKIKDGKIELIVLYEENKDE